MPILDGVPSGGRIPDATLLRFYRLILYPNFNEHHFTNQAEPTLTQTNGTDQVCNIYTPSGRFSMCLTVRPLLYHGVRALQESCANEQVM
jgi:hypothetical protein